jgi:hypothetical protein
MQIPGRAAPKLRLFQGFEGVKEIYEDMLRTPNSTIYAVIDAKYDPILSEGESLRWINNFVRRRSERNIWWRAIVNKSWESDVAVLKRNRGHRALKMIPGVDLRVSIEVYGGKVAITSCADGAIGFVLECEQLASSLISLHQAVWQTLPEYDVSSTALSNPQPIVGETATPFSSRRADTSLNRDLQTNGSMGGCRGQT